MAQDIIYAKPIPPQVSGQSSCVLADCQTSHLPQCISSGLWVSYFNYPLLHLRFSWNQYPCFPLSVQSQRNNCFSLSEIIIYLLSRCLYPYMLWNCPINHTFPFIQNPSLSTVFSLLFTNMSVYSLSSNKSLLWSGLYIKLPSHLFPLVGNFWK